MRRYKVLLPLRVHTADSSYAQGEEFDQEFTAEDEATNLASGLLELLPLTYRVVGGSEVHGAQPGETFTLPLPLGQEVLLVEGGHIERVDDEPAEVKPTKSSKSKES